jgi:transposase
LLIEQGRFSVVHSDPEAIAAFIKLNAPQVSRIGLETGATSTWLWTELNRLGLPIICIDASHAKAALRMQINKSDRNDAVGIARIATKLLHCREMPRWRPEPTFSLRRAMNSARPPSTERLSTRNAICCRSSAKAYEGSHGKLKKK